MGAGGGQMFANDAANPIDIGQYIIVPESHRSRIGPPRTANLLSSIATMVRSRFGVLPAIDFHDQSPFQTGEIDDVGTYRMLSPELASQQLSAPEMFPQLGFRVCHVRAQDAREIPLLPFPHGWSPSIQEPSFEHQDLTGSVGKRHPPITTFPRTRGKENSAPRMRGKENSTRRSGGTGIKNTKGRTRRPFAQIRLKKLTSPSAWRSPHPDRPANAPW
jgi:hypothetical protein